MYTNPIKPTPIAMGAIDVDPKGFEVVKQITNTRKNVPINSVM